MRRRGEQVFLLRVTGGGYDSNDDPIPKVIERIPVMALAVAPGVSQESSQRGREMLSAQLTVYMPSTPTPTENDELEVRGVRYQIEGRPIEWKSPFGTGPSGYEILCKFAQG